MYINMICMYVIFVQFLFFSRAVPTIDPILNIHMSITE